jgi:hypothetical protein
MADSLRRDDDTEIARLIRFLGSGYAPKAAQESPKKPWRIEQTDRWFLRGIFIKAE